MNLTLTHVVSIVNQHFSIVLKKLKEVQQRIDVLSNLNKMKNDPKYMFLENISSYKMTFEVYGE